MSDQGQDQDQLNQSQEDTSKNPQRARKAPEKFQPEVLMNFQKTEKSRSKHKDRVRKQAKRNQENMDETSSTGDTKNGDAESNNKK